MPHVCRDRDRRRRRGDCRPRDGNPAFAVLEVVRHDEVVQDPVTWSAADSRSRTTGGWGYAVFNHDPATGRMTADAAKADCGNTCHLAVKAKDYIFHPYQVR